MVGATQPAFSKFAGTESVFDTLAVSSIDCCWLATLYPHLGCLLSHMLPSDPMPSLALKSLQADINLGELAHGPHVTPAAGGRFILHHKQHNFASLSAPYQSSAQSTDQVRHALLHISLCEPTKQSRCSQTVSFSANVLL